MPDGGNQLIAQHRPFSNGRIERQFPGGFTIMEMMEMSGIDMPLAYRIGIVRIFDPATGGLAEIDRAYWHCTWPKPGMQLTLTLEPGKGGGGGKSILGIVLSIAVLAAGAWAGAALAAVPSVISALGATGAKILGGVVTGIIGFAGKLLVSALIPAATLPKPHSIAGSGASQADSPTYSLAGAQNQVLKYSPVPRVLGEFRFTPPFGALPYTEIVGADQYLRLLFCLGYGPLEIDEIKIGDTALEEYDDVETEIRQGYPDDDPITLYTNQVIEAAVSIEVKNDGIKTPAVAAKGVLTLSAAPGNGETATVGQTYTFVTVLTATANQVLIGADESEAAENLVAAITRAAGAGTVYGAPTALNTQVTAEVTGAGEVTATAKTAGTAGNSIATTETLGSGAWGAATLAGGAAAINYDPMDEDENWSTQTTGTNADEFSFDLTFPRGLVKYNSAGGKDEQTARFDVRYRLNGSSDDWTYVSAASHNELTVTANPGDGETITIGGKVYTVQATLTDADGHVQRGADAAETLGNLAAAINLASGSGTKYAASTTRHADVDASAAASVLTVTARHRGNRTGPDGDGVACTETLANGSWANAATVGGTDAVKVTAKETALRLGKRVKTGAPAKYDVQLRRVNVQASFTDTAVQDQAVWTALRTIRWSAPIRLQGLALLALRIRATDQLNGVIQNLSARCRSMAPIRESGGWTEPVVTRNPAWLYALAHRGAHLAEPIADEKLDLDGIEAWAAECDTLAADGEAKYTCDGVIDYAATIDDVARAIAATGRATPGMVDGKISIVRDVPQTVPVQHFTPLNSWGFKATKEFPDLPHAIRIRFKNEELDWEDDELTVYADGYDEDTATIFDTETAGLETRSNQIYRGIRYGMAQLKLRPEKYTLNADAEAVICRRGDLVKVLHDVPRWGSGWARIKSVTLTGDSPESCSGVVLDMGVSMAAGTSYVARFRRADAERADGGSQLVPVITVPGIQTTLAFQDPVEGDDIPEKGDLAMFGPLDQEARDLIVLGIRRGEDLSAELTFVDAAPAVHQADQGTIPAFDPGITSPLPIEFRRPEVPSIEDIRSDETVLSLNPDGSYVAAMVLQVGTSATGNAPTAAVQVQYRPNAGSGRWLMTPAVEIAVGQVTILGVDIGAEYDLRVRAISRAGVVSAWSAPISHTVIGDTTLPPVPENPRVVGDLFRWDYPAPPRDFTGGGFRVLYVTGGSPIRTGAAQLTGGLITTTSIDISSLTNGLYTVMVVAVDRSGNESEEAAFVVVDRGAPEILNAILETDYAADGFTGGTIVNGTVESGPELVADIEATAMWPSDPMAPMWSSNLGDAMWGAFAKEMTFAFTVTVATGDIGSSLKIVTTVERAGWTLVYSADGGATWLPWPGEVVTEATEYDFVLTTAPGGEQGRVSELRAILDVADEEEFLDDIAISSSGTRLALTKAFRSIDHVAATLLFHTGETALGFRFDDYDPDLGPLCYALDGSGTPTDGHGSFRVHGAKQIG